MPVYLDNAATTKPCSATVSAVYQNIAEDYGNPSSLHAAGLRAEKNILEARKAIAAALVCDPACITFNSGATEGNNTAVFAARSYGKRKKKIVISALEHPSVEAPVKYLEENEGFTVTRVKPGRSGTIDADVFLAAVDNDTCFASCLLVNNETGALQPVRRIFSRLKQEYPDCLTHCDAVQGFLKTRFKAEDLAAALITVSAHKVHAVKGCGAMYMRKGTHLPPLIIGGGQERGLRAGTESVPLIAGFGAAVRALLPSMNTAVSNAEEINHYLRKKLAPLEYITIHSPVENTSPFIISFSVNGVRSEILLHYLESRDIYVSSGSACARGKLSPTLQAMGIPNKLIDSALRVSFSRTTTMGEIDLLVKAIQEGVVKFGVVS
ncbi:MAG: cysteine desulfurase [Oscillospiraceae bacterium]|nr:cysteine desulfurase [Oscillospiraceae bacterium]